MASTGKTSVKQFNFGESTVNLVHIMSALLSAFVSLSGCHIATL